MRLRAGMALVLSAEIPMLQSRLVESFSPASLHFGASPDETPRTNFFTVLQEDWRRKIITKSDLAGGFRLEPGAPVSMAPVELSPGTSIFDTHLE